MYAIRLGKLQELPRLAAVERAAAARFPETDLPPDLAHPTSPVELQASINAGLLWVAEEAGGEVVGFVACQAVDSFLHIAEMDVHPNHGRRGIASALLQQVVSHASGLSQVQAVTLTTFGHLPWNAPFYARHGFAVLAAGGGLAHLERALAAESAKGLSNRVAMARSVA